MSSISNIPINARSMNGVITISDGTATMENGSLTNVNNIDTDSINTNSFNSNDFSINTNIDLTSDTSKLQFLYNNDPDNTVIDRNQITTQEITTQDINTNNINTNDINTNNINTNNIDISNNIIFKTRPGNEYGIFIDNVNNNLLSYRGGAYNSIMIGEGTPINTTIPPNNILIGSFSGKTLTSGNNNTVCGFDALNTVLSGSKNTVLGAYSLNGNTTGSFNTALGYSSGFDSNATQYQTHNSIFIGPYSRAGDNITNSVALGYECVVNDSNTIQLGSNNEIVKVSGDIVMNDSIIHNVSSLTSNNNLNIECGGEVLVNGFPINSTPNLSQVLGVGTDAGNQDIMNAFNIGAKQFIYDGFVKLNDVRTISTNLGTYTLTFPIPQILNVIFGGSITIYLPDLSILPSTGSAGSNIYILRGNNDSQVTLVSYSGQEIKLMDNSLVTSFLFNSSVSNMLNLMFTKVTTGGVANYRWVQVNPIISNSTTTGVIDTPALFTLNSFSAINTFEVGLESYGTTYVQNFTFENVSSDIAITNWDASSPAYTSNGYYAQASGSTPYTGTPGFIVSGTGYAWYILRGLFNGVFYVTYFPSGISSNQCFVLQTAQNKTINLKTTTYTLDPGGYTFGFYVQAQNTGGVIELDVYAKKDSGTILGSVLNISPYVSFPNWEFHTIAFNLSDVTNVYFEWQSNTTSYIYGGYICLVGVELTQNNALVVKDTTTGKNATIAGAHSILNELYVNDGLQINNGGLNVNGGISSGTAYGSNNTSMNTTLGSGSSTNPQNNVAIGSSALQNATTANKNVIIGSGSCVGATTASDNVVVGANTLISVSQTGSTLIGSNSIVRGNNSVVVGSITSGESSNQGCIGTNCVSVGNSSMGALTYNGFGALTNSDGVSIGYKSQSNNADIGNTSVGNYSFYNLSGRNGITANGNNGYVCQYNTALGYYAGNAHPRYNNCLFLGAGADATVDDLTNANAIGFNAQVSESNCMVLGQVGTKLIVNGDIANVTTINGVPYTGGGGGVTLAQVQANANIFTALQTFNNGLMMAERAEALTGANLNLTSNFAYYCGTKICIVTANANTYQIILPSPAIFNGSTTYICNRTNFRFTLSCSGVNFMGSYGSQITTHIVYPNQEVELYANGANWNIDSVKGVPYVERWYSTTNQSIANNAGSGTIVQFPTLDTNDITTTTGIKCWGGKDLTYYPTAGTNPQYSWGNNTGYTMTVKVEAQIQYSASASGSRALWISSGSGTSASTGGRYSLTNNLMDGVTTTFPGGVGYVRANATLTLRPNDYVILYTFQNSGGALNIINATANARGNITFTRIG